MKQNQDKLIKLNRRKNKDIILNSLILGLSFLIPIIIVVVGLYQTGVFPFGDRSYLSIDGLHQYLPFFTELYDKLHNGEDLFHSWSGGMGCDFFNIFTYYLLSPLTILIYFFPRGFLNEAVTVLILLKTGLAGLSMATVLFRERKRQAERSSWSVLLAVSFGIMYGLSNYVVGYHVNLMWMDAVVFLPWLTYALKRLIFTGRGCLYSLLLGLTILCNYYIGIAVCLYLVFYFICLLIGYGITKRRLLSFVIYSFLGGLLSFVVLIPAICQISSTKAAGTLTVALGTLSTIPSLLRQMLPGTVAVMTTSDSSLANIYCGSLAVLFLLLFFVLPTAGRRKKLGYAFLIGILFLSFIWTGLNLLFHGLHAGFGFPNRHAFLYCYVVLWVGYQAACTLMSKQKTERIAFFLSLLVMFAVIAELGCSTLKSIEKNGNADRNHLMERYHYVMERIDGTGELFRSDIVPAISRNEAMLYGQRCLSLFVSTISSDYVNTMHRLGFYTSLNRVQYAGFTDVTNMLFGVRYTEKLNRLSNKNPYSPIRDEDILVENKDILGIGYGVNEEVLDLELTSDNPFMNQNELLGAMTGKTLYQTEKLMPVNSGGSYQFTALPGYHYYVAIVDSTLPKDGQNTEEEVSVTEVIVNGVTHTSNCNRIYDIGESEQKEPVEISIVTGEADCYVGYYKEEDRTHLYRQLSKQVFHVESFRDNFVKGDITLTKPQVLFFSINANEGWDVTVDGKCADVRRVNNTFLAVPLEEGHHKVELTYQTRGVALGGGLSLVSLMILVVLFFIQRKERKLLQF